MSKKTLNLVVIGHKGAGKSTLAAHLVGKLGIHDKRLATRFEKEEVTCDFRYSWIQHQLKLEKARTTSIDNTMATIETRDYYCTVLDASGDPDSIRESIKLICQGDVALLVVDSSSDDIGFRCQTREYVLLAYALGLKHIICCCNKMDKTIPQYSEQRYRTILDEVSRYSIQVGYKKDEIQFVPISGLEGENLNQWCLFLDWYSGGTLIEAVNRIKLTRPLDGPLRPLRLPIHAFYKISGIGTVVVGRIQAGVVKPGMEIRIAPQPPTEALTARVKAIEMHGFPLAEAVPGDNVRLYLGNIVIKCIGQGQVLSESTVEPAKQTLSFTALVTIQNRKRPIREGYTAIIHSNLCHSTVRFAKLISKVDHEGKEEVEPVSLKNGDCAIVQMVPSGRNMVLETYEDCPALGRFVLRDTRETFGFGIIKSVDKQQQPSEDVEPTATTTLEELNDIIKEKEREARLQKLPVRRSNVEPTVDSEAPADNVGLEMLHELVVATGCSKEMGILSLRHTGNLSVQAAINWLREHEEDAHIDELAPAPLISKQSDAPQHSPDESVLSPPDYEESEFRTTEYDERGRVREESTTKRGLEVLEKASSSRQTM